MVLYRGETFVTPKPKALPESLNIPVWTIEETGEWFTDYDSYSSRMAFYKSLVFASELSSRANLSYFDAILDETEILNHVLNNIPLEIQLSLCKYALQAGELHLHKLSSKCFNLLNHEYFINDIVKFHDDLTKPIEDRREGSVIFDVAQPITDIDFKKYIDVEFIIKDKTTFEAINDDSTGDILVPKYSRYLIYVKDKRKNDIDSKLEKFIVDDSQIERIGKSPSLYTVERFVKLVFCPIKYHVISILKGQNIPLYLELKKWNDLNIENNEPHPELIIDTLTDNITDEPENDATTTNESTKRLLENDTEMENNMDSFKRFQKEQSSDKNNTEFLKKLDQMPLEKPPNMNDLDIPFQGAMNAFQGFYCFNDELESLPLDDPDKLDILYKNNPINKLLEVYQFVLTFDKVLRITPFNLDDFIMSIKCTDPFELTGEIVNVTLKSQQRNMSTKHEYPIINAKKYPLDAKSFRRESIWQRNSKIRKMIKDKDNDIVSYEILSNVPASDQQLEIAINNGMHLFINVVISMLSLIIDDQGNWRCQIVEEWFENSQIDESILSMDATLENILNYKGINWAERLSKREFRYGYWLIILLGVLQDSMHISKYTKIVVNFTKKIIPNTTNGNLPKNMFYNFCRKLTLLEKIDVLWVLMDIVANYSDDIKKWVNGTLKLVDEIKNERSKTLKLKLIESCLISQLTLQLDNVKKNPNSEKSLIEGLQKDIDMTKNNFNQLEKEEHYLSVKIDNFKSSNLKPLGVDRFGNRYYWIYKSDILSPGDSVSSLSKKDSLYYCGRLWVRGAISDMVKPLLNISSYQYNWWNEIAQTRGKVAATKEVFGIYRDKNGSFYKTENEIDVEILSSDGQIVGDYKLSNIEKKIINETPEKLLLDPNEWYFVQNASTMRNFLYKLNIWGQLESHLYANIFKNLHVIIDCFEMKSILTDTEMFNVMEERLLSELKKYTCSEADLKGLECIREKKTGDSLLGADMKTSENLEELAENVVSLHDTKITRRIKHRIAKLEYLRDIILEEQMNILNFEALGIRTMNFLEKTETAAIANKKLRKQMDILTDLLNYRHFKAIKSLSKWQTVPELRNAINGQNQQESLDVDEILRQSLKDVQAHIISGDLKGSSLEDYLPLKQKAKATSIATQPSSNISVQPQGFPQQSQQLLNGGSSPTGV